MADDLSSPNYLRYLIRSPEPARSSTKASCATFHSVCHASRLQISQTSGKAAETCGASSLAKRMASGKDSLLFLSSKIQVKEMGEGSRLADEHRNIPRSWGICNKQKSSNHLAEPKRRSFFFSSHAKTNGLHRTPCIARCLAGFPSETNSTDKTCLTEKQ